MLARERLGKTGRLGIDDEVDVALAVQSDVLAAVPRDHGKAHALEQRAHRGRIADVGRHGEGPRPGVASFLHRLCESVGAATGDMGTALRRYYPRAIVTSLDYREVHLAPAPQPKVIGDAFRLPFRNASFDFVFSSLFLHHFSDERVVDLFRNFAAVAGRAVLAIDLERGPLAYYFMPATRWLFGWHGLSMHDGPASVQAAFKRGELLALAKQAGLTHARASTHRPWARVSLVAPL